MKGELSVLLISAFISLMSCSPVVTTKLEQNVVPSGTDESIRVLGNHLGTNRQEERG